VTFPPRVVVTGPEGVVVSETHVISRRAGHRSTVVWATDAVPVFRITELAPGVASEPHRTDSIDYAVVLSGKIELVLDEESVTLRAGDVLVQRGTAHDWVNTGTEPCIVAFCLVGAAR
jgi:quercetin dioxygenase-like cupin family protein